MTHLICQTFYYFFGILDMILFLYILSSWFPNAVKFRYLLLQFLEPLFAPIRLCLKHSIFRTAVGDLTPLIALVVISYLQTFFYSMI